MRFSSFAVVFAALPGCALAQAASVPASLATAGPGVGQFVQVLLMLALVLALIVGAAWLARRFSLLPGQTGNQLRVVSGVMVGPKERVVIVEQGENWLVLGVTAHSVNLLHSQPRPEGAPESAPAASLPPFAEKLAALMKKGRG
ncbi:hypothetical protein JHS3_02010 [Jeongeupia sp. HS-3]|uniref:flagellar biosynthetic protein FliO n=1 Tax=Jeongeupia sp. HS-3 TaxID=1009682 RepID=UPI0018A5A7AA|nr:flagellar biosynthetic protein FliO [Jeongeupia sp. HS-3]BCL74465.1 hypothetical protein JHS3_02010 [Jeongeupia sp. HS-3]